jgi:hypothetical protein
MDMSIWLGHFLRQTSLNDLDKAEDVSRLRSPEKSNVRRFWSMIAECGLEANFLTGWQGGYWLVGLMEISHHSNRVPWEPN